MKAAHLGAFLAAALLVYVVPGPDFVVVLRGATVSRRAGLAAAAGAQTGLAYICCSPRSACPRCSRTRRGR